MSYFKDNIAKGCFKHKETEVWFDFRKTDYWWALNHDLEFEIAVRDPLYFGVRYARILKTVAYVAVDENQYGGPILEKWPIKILWEKNS